MDDRRVVAFLRVLIVLVAIAGVGLFIAGWYLNAKDAPPVLGMIIIGILFSVLGIRFPAIGSFKATDPDQDRLAEKKEENKDV